MTTKNNEEKIVDCSTAGKGFAHTGDTPMASESCGLPQRGFASIDFGEEKEKEVAKEDTQVIDCSTAGMGFARTDKTEIASENCAFPNKGFGTTDFGTKK